MGSTAKVKLLSHRRKRVNTGFLNTGGPVINQHLSTFLRTKTSGGRCDECSRMHRNKQLKSRWKRVQEWSVYCILFLYMLNKSCVKCKVSVGWGSEQRKQCVWQALRLAQRPGVVSRSGQHVLFQLEPIGANLNPVCHLTRVTRSW